MTSQPIAENHSSFPVLNIWALGAKAGDWEFSGPAIVAIFSEYQGLLPGCQKALLAGLAGLSCFPLARETPVTVSITLGW